MSRPQLSLLRCVAVAALLVAHTALLAWSAWRHSPTFDETAHLPAGISHWRFGHFDLYRVNPPLVRLVAAVPVLAAGAKTDWTGFDPSPAARPEFRIGNDFVEANGADAFWHFTLARWACVPFSLLGGYVCYRWARELWGTPAGLVALTLWCFSPIVLGNAPTIQPDAPAAALAVTACYLFWRWCRRPSLGAAFGVGVVLGLGLLVKTTLALFVPLLPLLWLTQRPAVWRIGRDRLFREFGQLIAICVLAVYVLNAGYLFDGTLKPLGDYAFVSDSLSGEGHRGGRYAEGGDTDNRFAGTWLASVPVPLPEDYVLGIDAQKRDFEGRLKSYLRGKTRYRGWWYYYLYGMVVKVPAGTWALLALAVGVLLSRGPGRSSWRDVTFLLLPMAAVLIVVSSQTGMNNHVRYVLPAFPFLFILASAAVSRWQFGRIVLVSNLAAALALLTLVGSSLTVYPHSHSHFNMLAGGPANGHFHLLSSNVDYGEDLLYLKEWLEEHAAGRPVTLAYFGNFDPRIAGIEFTLPPPPPDRRNRQSRPLDEFGPLPGLHAVSVNYLHGPSVPLHDGRGGRSYDDEYSYFLEFEPTARAGYGIHIYDLDIDEVNAVRRELGLPALPVRRQQGDRQAMSGRSIP